MSVSVSSVRMFSRLDKLKVTYTLLRDTSDFSMAAVELSFAESFGHELGERDGALTFEEACVQVQGQKLFGPLMKPLKGDRAPGDLRLIDLPLRDMSTTSGKCEQFVDIIQNHVSEDPLKVDQGFLDSTLYPLCAQSKYRDLPEPFCLKTKPTVPYSMQFIIVPAHLPPDQEHTYVDIFKHVYLHKNKVWAKDLMTHCFGIPVRFEWGSQTRLALAGLNFMLDRLGGIQVRLWSTGPKFEKKWLQMQVPVKQDISTSVTMGLVPTTGTSSWNGQTIKSIHQVVPLKDGRRAK